MVVFGMRSDPEPNEISATFHGECSMMQTDAHGPESAHLLEMERRMTRIISQQLVASVGEALHLDR
jgi:hypothetical protein